MSEHDRAPDGHDVDGRPADWRRHAHYTLRMLPALSSS